jgi:hypothetical protein
LKLHAAGPSRQPRGSSCDQSWSGKLQVRTAKRHSCFIGSRTRRVRLRCCPPVYFPKPPLATQILRHLDSEPCRTSLSDMAVLKVKNRDFQRATGEWLQKARQGEVVVIISPEGPPLTLRAGQPKQENQTGWEEHLAWLKRQPKFQVNPVDEIRRGEGR